MAIFQPDFLAILGAAVAYMILGVIWYSPAVGGERWFSLLGWTREKFEENRGRSQVRSYIFVFLGALVTAYVLSYVLIYMGAYSVFGGIKAGFWMWLGFTAMTGLGTTFFEKKPEGLFFIDAGYNLFGLMIMGAVLAFLR